jgi:AAA+ ATPase superfamily predicted ATPase
MGAIIGRQKETSRLSDYVGSGKSEFLVVYGRRRIGKTFLIKEFFKNKFSFYLSGAENADKTQQLINFNNAINEYSGAPYPKVNDWQSAFMQLKHLLSGIKTENRIVVFFDELPWLDNAKSGFLSAFEYFWNTYASSNDKIFLIACGSSTSWITNNILKNRGGLHNRVTRQIFLEPFTLKETELFLKYKKIVMDRYQIMECYMIMGGVPYYLEQLEKHYSLYQNIDHLFFNKNGVLRDEFQKIYSSLYKNPEKHIKIINVLAKKRKGLTREEIVVQSKIADGGGLTRVLEELELCGFISINNNFSTPKRNHLYQLVDLYSLFYLNFVKDRDITDVNFWTNTINTPLHNSWKGFAFELLCQHHIFQIRKKLGISGVTTNTSSWKNSAKTVQIDLIINRNDNVINLCEMKCSKDKYIITKSYSNTLRNKIAEFIEETRTKKAVHLTMVTTCGVAHNEYWGYVQSEVVTDDLFE